MVLWFYGFMVLWFYGFMVLWFYGFKVLSNGAEAAAQWVGEEVKRWGWLRPARQGGRLVC
jgi:hypothetical protein